MHATVVIPSYNTQDSLGATLSALTQQAAATIDYEILVVDCSTTNAVANLIKQYPTVSLLRETTRFNPGIGRNIGAHHAKGDLLVFIDADVVLEPDALLNAVSHHQQGAKIFGGALELNEATSVGAASYLEHYFFNHESQRTRGEQSRNNLSSALMCFDKAVFIHSGGFKDIPRMQDMELTERLRSEGYPLRFFPDIVGLQTQDSPLKKVLGKVYINGQNLFYIRYEPTLTTLKRVWFAIALPALAAVKTCRIIARHLRYQPLRNKLTTLLISPLLLVAGAYWMAGFYKAMVRGEGISKSRD